MLLEFVGLPSETLTAFAFILGYSFVMGGLPYVVLIMFLRKYFNGKTVDWYVKFSFALPIIFAVILFVIGAVLVLVFDFEEAALRIGAGYAVLGLLFGYGYVFLVHAVYAVLKRLQFVREDALLPTPGPQNS